MTEGQSYSPKSAIPPALPLIDDITDRPAVGPYRVKSAEAFVGNAPLMLTHESNQQTTHVHDSGDTSWLLP